MNASKNSRSFISDVLIVMVIVTGGYFFLVLPYGPNKVLESKIELIDQFKKDSILREMENTKDSGNVSFPIENYKKVDTIVKITRFGNHPGSTTSDTIIYQLKTEVHLLKKK